MSSINIGKYIALIIVFFSCFHLTYAAFEITEIMYDLDGTDTDREWVEVQNTGAASDDLSKWYLFSANTKHALSPQGESSVPSMGYAVIAQNVVKFKTDWPNFSGLLFDSSWTGFNNDGATVALKDPDLNVMSSVTFDSSMGASGDGNSLQKVNGAFQASTPTPGQGNVGDQQVTPVSTSVASGGATSATSSTVSSTTTKTVAKKEVEVPKFTTEIISKNIVTVSVPFSISSSTLGLSKEVIDHGRFVWNFGDGMSKEESEPSKFFYVYDYPGEYLLILSYYPNYYTTDPLATDRLVVKVLPADLYISAVGSADDPFVEIENKSTYEMSVSGWTLKGFSHSFYIPEGTIILPGKKLKLSPKVTGFNFGDLSSVSLSNPNGQVVSNYPAIKIESRLLNKVKTSNSTNRVKNETVTNSTKNEEVVNLDNLGANAVSSNQNTSSNFLALMGLVLIVGLGFLATWLFHKKNTSPDDLDKEIRAEDVTIIE
jgi:hypothetical protein